MFYFIGDKISIHAPLTGCDLGCHDSCATYKAISIHAPLTGCDLIKKV